MNNIRDYKAALAKYSPADISLFLQTQGIADTGKPGQNAWLAALAIAGESNRGLMINDAPQMVENIVYSGLVKKVLFTDKYILLIGYDKVQIYDHSFKKTGELSLMENVNNTLTVGSYLVLQQHMQRSTKISIIDLDKATVIGSSIYNILRPIISQGAVPDTVAIASGTSDFRIREKSIQALLKTHPSPPLPAISTGTPIAMSPFANGYAVITRGGGDNKLLYIGDGQKSSERSLELITQITLPRPAIRNKNWQALFDLGDDLILCKAPKMVVIYQLVQGSAQTEATFNHIYTYNDDFAAVSCIYKNTYVSVIGHDLVQLDMTDLSKIHFTQLYTQDSIEQEILSGGIDYIRLFSDGETLALVTERDIGDQTYSSIAFFQPSDKQRYRETFGRAHELGSRDRARRHPQINRLPPELVGYIEEFL